MLFLPVKYVGPTNSAGGPSAMMRPSTMHGPAAPVPSPDRPLEHIPDDRLEIQPGDSILLVVEDDPHYARVIWTSPATRASRCWLPLGAPMRSISPSSSSRRRLSLDVFLPDMLGWTVLSQLKQNPLTRHIPVQIITLDEDRQHALARGAFSFVTKPTTTEGVDAALTRIKEYASPRP